MIDQHEGAASALALLTNLAMAEVKLPPAVSRKLTAAVEAVTDLPDELVIVLRKPVTLGTEAYHELKLREPTAAEWTQWDKLDGVDADVKAVATVSGLPHAAVAMIGTRDLITASKYIAAFL